jgi:4-hydroxythreonine-4-phosphate dehydrogenase
MNRPLLAPTPLALTMGEPAGVGPEITLKAWAALRGQGPAFAVVADPRHLARVSERLGLAAPLKVIGGMAEVARAFADALPVLPIAMDADAAVGEPNTATAPAVIAAIDTAVALARSGDAAAVVTNPIQKAALTAAGFGFPGHTEYLEHLSGPGHRARMLLAGGGLRVIPITIHEPLRTAIARLTTDMIVEAGRDAADALRRDFAIARPRIAVAGLNPHAGEEGTLGREEIDIIYPAVKQLLKANIDASGPHAPDTMFTPEARARYDVALCMYHDQGLIPLKTLDMMGGVNVTLGLPFVRTSPDHGTALDIAAQGVASPSSLIAAIRMAAEIAGLRRGAGRKAA